MNRKHIVIVALCAVIAVGAIWSLNTRSAVAVEAVLIKDDVFIDTFREDGTVRSVAERPVYSEVDGLVEAVYVENGGSVLVGDAILSLNVDQLTYQHQALQGQLMSIQGQKNSESEKVKTPDLMVQQSAVNIALSTLTQAKVDASRSEELYNSGALSLNDYELVVKTVRDAEEQYQLQSSRLSGLEAQNSPGSGTIQYYDGQIIQIEAEIKRIEDQITKSVIKAQKAGVISQFNLKAGEAVVSMTPVATIIDKSELKIESQVLTQEAFNLKVGQDVIIIRNRKGLEDQIAGRITKVSPVATESVSTLGLKEKRILVEVKPLESIEPALIPGSDVEVDFVAYKTESAHIVPKSALFPVENGDAVWVIRDGKTEMQIITKGYSAVRSVEIIEGLEEGDYILKNFDTEGIDLGTAVTVN